MIHLKRLPTQLVKSDSLRGDLTQCSSPSWARNDNNVMLHWKDGIHLYCKKILVHNTIRSTHSWQSSKNHH